MAYESVDPSTGILRAGQQVSIGTKALHDPAEQQLERWAEAATETGNPHLFSASSTSWLTIVLTEQDPWWNLTSVILAHIASKTHQSLFSHSPASL